MKDNIKLLNYLIASEARLIEEKRNLCKENKLMIYRLQNKLMALEKDIVEHKQLIKEYRDHLKSKSQLIHTRSKLMSVK